MKLILNVIAAVSLAIAGAAGALIYLSYKVGVPQEETNLKVFLENYGLNLLGDTLAGIMALITLLVVIASLVFQMQQFRETANEMRAQNAVAKTVARANYKFALFDKRLAVYTEFGEELLATGATGSFDRETFNRLLKARDAAKNLFFDNAEINQWLDTIMEAARNVLVVDIRIDGLEKRQREGAFGELDQEELKRLRSSLEDAQGEFRRAYDWREAKKMFLPYLRLDSDVVFVAND